ncbi:MAG: tRNA nucleotidyltransferase, partial [Firmicutes bacterium]|nr:tRNA nucleotidyltransferase [Bacillota bacterium]
MYTFEQSLQMARQIAERATSLGGRVYFVGGHVRDHLLQKENKDIDIEVHGITPAQLEAILDELGERLSIGESFGIYGLRGYSLDIAMPRKEELRGRGHRDFDIFVAPFIGTEGAAKRRDFTINALMMDVLTGEIVDHYGGQADLNAGILRH